MFCRVMAYLIYPPLHLRTPLKTVIFAFLSLHRFYTFFTFPTTIFQSWLTTRMKKQFDDVLTVSWQGIFGWRANPRNCRKTDRVISFNRLLGRVQRINEYFTTESTQISAITDFGQKARSQNPTDKLLEIQYHLDWLYRLRTIHIN